MRISARNILKGKVVGIEAGAVNMEVSVAIAPGVEMTSIITKKSAADLGLAVGKQVYVLVKASNVMIGVE